MNKKLILTSIIAISFAMPAMAEITNNATCDTTNLGQSENNSTANVEATWTPNRYRINYQCDNGDIHDADMSCEMLIDSQNIPAYCFATYDQSYTFREDFCGDNEGHTFAGWSCTDSNNNTTTYTAGQTVAQWSIESALTCTAQWTANRINIDWDPKNGEQHTTNYCTYGETITLPTEPTKTGYTFGGWILKPCSSYTTEQTCPTEQCQWKAGSGDTGTCMTPEAYCASFDSENTCDEEFCGWDDENNVCEFITSQSGGNSGGALSLLG